jgi:hypothetical protein
VLPLKKLTSRSRGLRDVAVTIVLLGGLVAGGGALAAERAGVELNQGVPIQKNYKSWSLFLVCDPARVADTPAAHEQMKLLFTAFASFSKTIGSENLAVWFTKTRGAKGVDHLPAKGAVDYDAQRAADYCTTYRLKSVDSPFVVVTTRYPTKTGDPGNFYAVSLGKLDPDNQLNLLGKLSDKVRVSDLNTQELDSNRYWRRWAQILQDAATAMGKLVKAIKFSVDVKAFSLDFDGGKLQD